MKLIYVFSLLDNLHVSAAWFEPVAGQEATVRLYQRASEAKDHTHTYQVATGQLLSTTGASTVSDDQRSFNEFVLKFSCAMLAHAWP
jgi:hypothetical protein